MKKLYKIAYKCTWGNDNAFIYAKTPEKALKKFIKRYNAYTIYSINKISEVKINKNGTITEE